MISIIKLFETRLFKPTYFPNLPSNLVRIKNRIKRKIRDINLMSKNTKIKELKNV